MGKKIKVLVADDEIAVNEVICDALAAASFEVESVFDGAQAIARSAVFGPDVVILDVMMPKENGYRVSRQIKSQTEGKVPKVLILTGRRLSEWFRKEAGAKLQIGAEFFGIVRIAL